MTEFLELGENASFEAITMKLLSMDEDSLKNFDKKADAFYKSKGLYLIRQFLVSIPKDLIENARMDGASNLEIFFKVVLPLGKSALYVQGLFGFMGAWNDVQWAQLIIGNAPRSTWTLAYGLKVISDNAEAAESMTLAFASAVITMIPIFIVYLFAQSKIIEGVANTGVKR